LIRLDISGVEKMKRSTVLKFVPILILALVFGISAQSASAESLKSADSAVRSGRDNTGKQLAMATPRTSKEKNAKKDDGEGSAEAAIVSVREQIVGHLKSHNISVPVPAVDIPEDMEKTCNTCYHAVRTVVTFAQEHSAEFGGWFCRYLKQLSGPPAMTPCGSPYSTEQKLVPSNFGHHNSKLFLTDEGRLKTVISR
jgi:hypothetical protein